MELKKHERIDDLEYKGLKIIQNCNGFCFGVDCVLLSDFAREIKKNSKVVDIGSGTGIVSLLLSKKADPKKIYSVEIQEEMAEMSKRSVELNNLNSLIEVINSNIKDIFKYIEPHKIDAVVTNPPYKKNNTGVKSADKMQLISRHEVECNLEDSISISEKLLKDLGEFYMVHRAERLVDIMTLLRKYKLEPKKVRFVHSKPNEKPTLILVKAIRGAGEYLKIEKPLVIYNEQGEYTDEILEIYDKKRK